MLTIKEMADRLEIDPNTVKQRLFRAEIKPLTNEALYDLSALKAIRNVPGKGRPKKQKTKNNP